MAMGTETGTGTGTGTETTAMIMEDKETEGFLLTPHHSALL
jgi:hypothetical protein